jgi:hypothetical protein
LKIYDLIESSCKIKLINERKFYNVAYKEKQIQPEVFNTNNIIKTWKTKEHFPLNWTGQSWSLFSSLLYNLEGYFK